MNALVFRDYDQAALDAQYNNRAAVPDHEAFFDAYRKDSAAAMASLTVRTDLAYGPTPAETLDFFPAAGGGTEKPCIVFIHGGYWFAFDKLDFAFPAPAYTAAGVHWANVNYALAPTVPMDEIVRQCRASIAWIWLNAGDLGINRDRIVVTGHSAGGHLTAMMAATDWPAFDPKLPSSIVHSGLAISGLYELEPIRLCYLNEKIGLNADQADRNSPRFHLPNQAPPLGFSVGGRETGEFLRQQDDFVAAWRGAGLNASVTLMPDCHHFDIVQRYATPGDPLFNATMALADG